MTVACYCHDFLKADMQHVYRQIVSMQRWKPVVICQKREHADVFPFSEKSTSVLPKPPWRWWRRNWYKHIKRQPLQISTGRVIAIMKEIYRYDADVVHVYFGHMAIQLLPLLKTCPKPVVVSFHGADVGVDVAQPAMRAALEGVFTHARLVLGRSESLLEGLRALGCPAEKLRLQRTGVPLADWPYQERPWPTNGEWHLLQACRLVAKKGLRATMTAFREIQSTHPNARLTIIGDGPMRAELTLLAKDWGLENAVHFPGFLNQSDLRAAVQSAHIFLHPSETPADGNREGVPNAMLEAMATGLPVLGTYHGGIPEAITHDVSGWLVPEGDAAGLAAGALAIMSSAAKYRAMAAAAHLEVATKFARAPQTAILEGYYDEAAQS
jgi:colanic acid/amylovoran biosynthesis glycosyltransferase